MRAGVGAARSVLEVAGVPGETDSPRFVSSVRDARASPGADADDGGAARVLRSHRYADDEVYLWINRTPGGLRLSARYPGILDTDVRGFAHTVTDVVAEVSTRSSWQPRA